MSISALLDNAGLELMRVEELANEFHFSPELLARISVVRRATNKLKTLIEEEKNHATV